MAIRRVGPVLIHWYLGCCVALLLSYVLGAWFGLEWDRLEAFLTKAIEKTE